jgi:hypothetical protein
MNKQELIEKIENLNKLYGERHYVAIDDVLNLVTQLDEAPRYLKNLIARLRELQLHDREVWLKAIMSEFEQDFSHAKWREGYEQGKFEGMIEREKVKVQQFVADWYEENKDDFEFNVWDWIVFSNESKKLENKEFNIWINDSEGNPIQTLVNMHQFGYEVEKEKRYRISMPKARNYKNHAQFLCEKDSKMFWCAEWYSRKTKFTRKELEQAGFSWVFDCPGIDIKEVKNE